MYRIKEGPGTGIQSAVGHFRQLLEMEPIPRRNRTLPNPPEKIQMKSLIFLEDIRETTDDITEP
jgi:hypothetical protein